MQSHCSHHTFGANRECYKVSKFAIAAGEAATAIKGKLYIIRLRNPYVCETHLNLYIAHGAVVKRTSITDNSVSI